jgi:NADPH:quinone reductase-like Zn-dependent oxidoreductase
MKAITLTKNGDVENFVTKELPRPTPQPGEILIQTKAISVNPVDNFVRAYSQAMETYLQPRPGEDIVIGWDVAGTVIDTGTDVSDFKKGDEVFGLVKFPGNGRGYAEYVTAPADQLALKPSNVSFEEAAAATLAALTAWQSLVTYGKIQKGEKVLIHAASGGVGHYAVQIAKHLGAYVAGTASTANREFVLSLGADGFIDYTKEKFEAKVKDADLVLDPIAGDHVLQSIDAVRPGGRIITLLTFFEGPIAEKAHAKGLFTHRLNVVSNGADQRQIAGLLEKGALRSRISEIFSFDEMGKAHQKIAAGKTRGKIVVKVA